MLEHIEAHAVKQTATDHEKWNHLLAEEHEIIFPQKLPPIQYHIPLSCLGEGIKSVNEDEASLFRLG